VNMGRSMHHRLTKLERRRPFPMPSLPTPFEAARQRQYTRLRFLVHRLAERFGENVDRRAYAVPPDLFDRTCWASDAALLREHAERGERVYSGPVLSGEPVLSGSWFMCSDARSMVRVYIAARGARRASPAA
jgi:hypothetical protein